MDIYIYIYIYMYVHMYMYMYVGTYVYVCEPGTLLIICQCVILGQSFIGFLLLFLCGLVMARGLQGDKRIWYEKAHVHIYILDAYVHVYIYMCINRCTIGWPVCLLI